MRIDPGIIRAQTNLPHPAQRVPGGILGGKNSKQKSPGNVMNCPDQ